LKPTNAALVTFWREESKVHVGARDEEFDPTLTGSHRLIGCDLESHLFSEELQ
jgi:hypothetical protein